MVPPADGVGPTADGVAPRTATVPPADGVGAPTEGRSNLSNPPPPPRKDVEGRSGLRNPTPPPPEAGSSSGLVDLTVEELKEALKKANAKAKAEKKRLQEETDVTRKRIREAREELRTAMEEGRKKAKSTVKAGEAINAEFDDGDDSGDGFCDDDSDVKPIRKRLTAVEKWANGNKAMRERKDMYIKSVTVNTVQEVYAKLCTGGIAIMNNMKTLFGPNHQPDREQRDYIRHAPESEKQIVFEGVVLDDLSSSVIPHYHKDHVDARRQLKDTNKKAYLDYKAKYAGQQVDIIEAMFDGAAGMSGNWKLNWNALVGGINYQHPHTDAGRVGSFQNLEVFPFVALHGFGLDPFSLWLLPDPFELKYGFLHTFEAHQIVFMRGDVVHAGVPSPVPRGHMEFFPLHGAGWTRRPAYWTRKGHQQVTYPWQHPTYPFGYPDVGSANENGAQIVTYPVDVTFYLQHPLKHEQVSDEFKKKRKKIKKRMTAQLESY